MIRTSKVLARLARNVWDFIMQAKAEKSAWTAYLRQADIVDGIEQETRYNVAKRIIWLSVAAFVALC